MAYAGVYGFYHSTKQTINPKTPSEEETEIDETTATGKQRSNTKKLNGNFITKLTMEFTSESLIGILFKIQIPACPREEAYKIVDLLLK